MAYSLFQRERAFDRTGGRCHLCHGDLDFGRYEILAHRHGWEVEHSRSRATGGTNHPNNLSAACVSCNRSKGARSAASYRREPGLSGPPPRERETGWGEAPSALGLFAGAVVVLGALAEAAAASPQRPARPSSPPASFRSQ